MFPDRYSKNRPRVMVENKVARFYVSLCRMQVESGQHARSVNVPSILHSYPQQIYQVC